MGVAFYNLSSAAGLKKLDEYLLSRSYISGYQASKDDLAVHAALAKPPSSEYVNASRWFHHIEALLRISGVSGDGCGVTVEGSAPLVEDAMANLSIADTKATAADEDDDDSDVDLFGEETEEEKKASEERAAAVKASGKKKESMANKNRDRDLWGDESVQNYPPNGFKPETRTLVKQVDDLIVTSFVCVKGNPCKIVEIRTLTDAAKRQFIAIDIFNGKVYKATFPLSGDCLVPIVTLSDYKLVYICEEDSQVILLDDKGRNKCNLKLPTDEALLSEIKFEFAEGKDVFVSVVSAMGKEQIIAATRKSLLQRYYPKVT